MNNLKLPTFNFWKLLMRPNIW